MPNLAMQTMTSILATNMTLGENAASAIFEFWFPLLRESSHAFLLILQCKA